MKGKGKADDIWGRIRVMMMRGRRVGGEWGDVRWKGWARVMAEKMGMKEGGRVRISKEMVRGK